MNDLRASRLERAQRAIDNFQTAPSTVQEAKKQLLAMASVVREHLEADGAKIYVLRRHPKGPMVWRLCNTRHPHVEADRVRLSLTEGWADWVIREGRWLRIPHVLHPVKGTAQSGESEGGKKVQVVGRSGNQMNPKAGADEDRETCALLCPLRGPSPIAGTLFVWRENEDLPELDAAGDLEVLMRFAPQVASACQRLLHLEKAEDQLRELSILGEALGRADDLRSGYNAVAAGTGRLADSAFSVLLHYDPPDLATRRTKPKLFPTGIWANEPVSVDDLAWAHAAYDCSEDPSSWESDFCSQSISRVGTPSFRSLLLPSQKSGTPGLAIALFDEPRIAGEPEIPQDELLRHHAPSFLQAATVLLKSHVADLGTHLSEALSGPPKEQKTSRNDLISAQGILLQAAKLLKQATGADEALVYRGPVRQMRVRGSASGRLEGHDLRVHRGSLTDGVLQTRRPRRVLDAREDMEHLKKNGLEVLTAALGWHSLKSWMCCAVHLQSPIQSTLGLIKLLTLPSGLYLGPDALQIAREVATHAAWEMFLAEKRSVLEGLGKLSRNLSGRTGQDLGDSMAIELATWARQSFLRETVAVAIIARRQGGQSLVRTLAPRREYALDESLLEGMTTLSEQLVASDRDALYSWPRTLSKEDSLIVDARKIAQSGVAASIAIPGAERLAGHLFVLDEFRFSPTEEEHVVEAARSMAVLLNAERERQEIKQAMSLFRHAMLGPIHGVVSSALALNEHSKDPSSKDAQVLSETRLQLLRDAEILSLWRDNERFYMRDPVEIKIRRQALRPIVDHCFTRYKKIFAERKVAYTLKWPSKGEFDLDLDRDALDLALSNLLDNAQKYCFYDRETSVEVRTAGNRVQVIIEDVGHGIPPEEVYKILGWGRRSPKIKLDPFRVIPGEGMGLPMTQAIIAAHRGRLRCSSELIGSGARPETAPHRVRMTIELPFTYARGLSDDL